MTTFSANEQSQNRKWIEVNGVRLTPWNCMKRIIGCSEREKGREPRGRTQPHQRFKVHHSGPAVPSLSLPISFDLHPFF